MCQNISILNYKIKLKLKLKYYLSNIYQISKNGKQNTKNSRRGITINVKEK